MNATERKSEAELMLDSVLLVGSGAAIGAIFANSPGTGVVAAAIGYIVTRYKGVVLR